MSQRMMDGEAKKKKQTHSHIVLEGMMDRWREKQDRSLEGLEGATEKKKKEEMQQQDAGEDETRARREREREREREKIIERRGVKKGCRGKLGEQFAWLHSTGDFNYFSAPLPLLVMSRMLRSPAPDYLAFVRASARCQAVITFSLESISARQKAYKAITRVLSFSGGLKSTVRRNSKVKAGSSINCVKWCYS